MENPEDQVGPDFILIFYLYFIFIYLWKDEQARSGGSKGVNLNTWALPFKAQEKWRRESGRWIGGDEFNGWKVLKTAVRRWR